MERERKSEVREMFGPWVYITSEPLFKPRYRVTDLLTFAASGAITGLAVANLLHHLLTPGRASSVSAILICLLAAGQLVYFVGEMRRMREMHEQIKASAKRVEMMIQDATPEAEDGPRTVQ